jgi:hypothetical protein
LSRPLWCKDWQGLPAILSNGPQPKLPLLAVNGVLLGMLLATEVPAGEIAKVLPRGLRLPAGVQPADPYPVSIAFGHQHDVHMAHAAWLPGSSYFEFAVGVSDLELEKPIRGFTGPVAILGRLDLNAIFPIILGRLLGLQKVLRRARTDQNAFGLRTFWRGETVAYGSMDRTGERRLATDFADLRPMFRTFEQPLASRTIIGTLTFTRFVWHWDQGYAQPITCELGIDKGLGCAVYAMPAGANGVKCTGAWQIKVPWTMLPNSLT